MIKYKSLLRVVGYLVGIVGLVKTLDASLGYACSGSSLGCMLELTLEKLLDASRWSSSSETLAKGSVLRMLVARYGVGRFVALQMACPRS